MPVVFTQAALRSLSDIRAYIGQDNPAAACDRLEYLPERGRPGLVPDTREIVALWPYVVVYRVTPEAVEIVNVWHGA